MAQQGGYRKPNNPAPVSGPGSLSQRTDGGPTQPATYIPGLPYGQGQETYNNQVAAPMAGNPMASFAMPDITPINAPTTLPNEPITNGSDFGPGATSASLNLPTAQPTLLSVLRQIAQNDPSGETELIYKSFEDRGF